MTFEEAVEKLELRDFITEEPLAPEGLIELFKDDFKEMISRPGSWEAEKMSGLLISREYHPEIDEEDVEMLKSAVVGIFERSGYAQSRKMFDLLQSHGVLEEESVSMEI